MKRMLFNATYHEELRVALVDGQKLLDFDIETTSKAQRRGNVYKGIITRIEPSLEACFVDYGTERQGFLPFKEIDIAYLPFEAAKLRDFGQLKVGTESIVQVEKDERGKKGAALTTFVSLPGRYLVLMPNNSRAGGISRRIEGDERDELKAILSQLVTPREMSVIARTAALGRTSEELEWDLNYLIKLWDAIKTAKENQAQAGGFLIYQESNLVIRSIRYHFSPDISEILIDKEDVYYQAKQFISNIMPAYVSKVKLYRDDIPLFSRFQIEHQIESVYARMVVLPSGGSIAIDPTEALTAIDVNSAKSIKGSDIEATALATNLEAAEEIARQMRLRDTGGLVVVDFIDMENIKNQREVEAFFRTQLSLDKARVQMGRISRFGLLELSRQRLKSSLDESITISCPRCGGTGSIRGIESVAVHVLRIVQEETIKYGHHISALHVQLPVDVATYLLNEKREDVAKLESRSNIKVILVPNAYLESPHYKIKRIGNSNYEMLAASNKLSYNLVEEFEDSYTAKEIENSKQGVEAEAVVKDVTPSQPAPLAIKAKASVISGLVKALAKIFKSKDSSSSRNHKTQERGKKRSMNSSNGSRSTNTNANRTRNGNSSGNTRGNSRNSVTNSSNPRARSANNSRGASASTSTNNRVNNHNSNSVEGRNANFNGNNGPQSHRAHSSVDNSQKDKDTNTNFSHSANIASQQSTVVQNNPALSPSSANLSATSTHSGNNSNQRTGYRGGNRQNINQNTVAAGHNSQNASMTSAREQNNLPYNNTKPASSQRGLDSVNANLATVTSTSTKRVITTVTEKPSSFITEDKVTTRVVESSRKEQTIVVAAKVEEQRKPVVAVTPNKPTDLGGFEMVSTDKKFMDKNSYSTDKESVVVDNRKRHNDIKKMDMAKHEEAVNSSYQQVETNKS